MGRTFVTFEEAAVLMKCTKRTVHNYVKRGRLRREIDDGVVVLRREDVEQLMDEEGSELPALNNRVLLELLSRVKTLEMQVSVFRKMNSIEELSPLRPNEDEALKILGNVRLYLQKTKLVHQEITLWVSLFRRMDEVTFELFRKAGAPEDFWQDIFNLCVRLIEFVSDPKKCQDSRVWLEYHLELNECRKNLRSIVLMWVEMGRGKATPTLRKYLDGGRDDLVRRLTSH